MLLAPLPYRPDSTALFEAIADAPWAVFLDSGRPYGMAGRWDILAAHPAVTLVTRGAVTAIQTQAGVTRSDEDPFQLVRRYLGHTRRTSSHPPFWGGAIGYWGYDLGRRIEHLPGKGRAENDIPEMAVGIYDWVVAVDHLNRQAWLVSEGRYPDTRQRWPSLLEQFSHAAKSPSRSPFRVRGDVQVNMTRDEYGQAFKQVQQYIHDGDCYQVNLAMRYGVPVEGDPWRAYLALRQLNPAPFGAYLNLPFGQVISSSPERFLEVRCGRVETKPIKGTRPRSEDPVTDAALVRELMASEKDRAENLMIVDLLRNDLGKVCVPGSVAVPRLFDVESYATVHHLVSTVTGMLREGVDAIALLRAAFPGGSITGAPKLRAMQIIDALEPSGRSIYCGSIGWLGSNGDMDTSIAIRTMLWREGGLYFWAGGGIVADSDEEAEFQECQHKAKAMQRLLAAHRLA